MDISYIKDRSIPVTESGCWIWLNHVDYRGYGTATVNRKPVKAHRLSFELSNGRIGDGLLVCHKCDTPSCVNPAHLFPGSQADNMADKKAKGRQANGSKISGSELTEADVIAIYSSPDTIANLAEQYKVKRGTIQHIKAGDSWRHVTQGMQRGDDARGVRMPDSKVLAIFVATGRHSDIARLFGVSPAVVSQIKHKQRYKRLLLGL